MRWALSHISGLPSLPAQPGVVLLSICSSRLPTIKSPALQVSYQPFCGAPGAELMPGALSVPRLRPLAADQPCHGANGGAAAMAAGSHLAPHRVPRLALVPTSIPMGLRPCAPWGFLQALIPFLPWCSILFPTPCKFFMSTGPRCT